MLNPELVDEPPDWVSDLELALMFHVAPWDIEHAPLWWKTRIAAFANAQALKAKYTR